MKRRDRPFRQRRRANRGRQTERGSDIQIYWLRHFSFAPRDSRRLKVVTTTAPVHPRVRDHPSAAADDWRRQGGIALRAGANLSDAAGAVGRGLRRWSGDRHPRAADRTIAVRAVRPAIRRREPARRRRQYRHRGRRARAAGRLYAALRGLEQMINATLYEKLNFDFIRDIALVAGIIPRASGHVEVNPHSGQDDSRIHRLCQGQSGQDQHGFGGQRDRRPCAAELFKMMAGVDMQHVPYRGAPGADRSTRRTSASHVRQHALFVSSTLGPAGCAHWR